MNISGDGQNILISRSTPPVDGLPLSYYAGIQTNPSSVTVYNRINNLTFDSLGSELGEK